jgi:hypothetical protein
MTLAIVVHLQGAGPSRRLHVGGERILLGRGRENDVRVPHVSVARRHATLRRTTAGYELLDEEGSGGTFLGDTRVRPNVPTALRGREWLRLGHVWLEVTPCAEPEDGNLRLRAEHMALSVVAASLTESGASLLPRVQVHTPSGVRTVELPEPGVSYTVGSGPDCTLQITDGDLEEVQVAFVRRGGSVFARDASGLAPQDSDARYLRADAAEAWRGQRLAAGTCEFVLEEPVRQALEALETAPTSVDGTPPPRPAEPWESGTALELLTEGSPEPAGEGGARTPARDGPLVSPGSAPAEGRGAWGWSEWLVVTASVVVLGASALGLLLLLLR